MTAKEILQYISTKYGEKLSPLDTGRYDPLCSLSLDNLLEICEQLRDDSELTFDYLCCITGIDTGECFEVIYSLASTAKRHRLDMKLTMPYENASVKSIQKIWPAANWYERELWELYGIEVENHGNLKRFLLPDDWDEGFPMRKDWDGPGFERMPEL